MLDFDTNGTPEALDERNPYSATSRSHWEGSRALERGPGPQKWSRWQGEAFKYEATIRSSWATKVSEIGQQALVGAEGAEESQGRKDHGIPATYESMATKPWLRKHGWAEGRET